MEREEAYDADVARANDDLSETEEELAPVHYTYRHGDGSATIVSAELCDSSKRRLEIVETGAALVARVRIRFQRAVEEPVVGFLIRNRHGIHAYGTNTKEQRIKLGSIRQGQTLTVSFSFNCWLGIDDYSISFAVHSQEGQAYDWLDGTLFFRVVSQTITEGIANLNATATVVNNERKDTNIKAESMTYG
jgi:hypothetical protein